MIHWPIEDVPDEHRLFYRVHSNYVINGEIQPGAFREQSGAMSTDWEKYSTSIESLERAHNPSKNGIVSLDVGSIRAIDKIEVAHAPDESTNNRAHTHVLGIEIPRARRVEVRSKLLNNCGGSVWVIPVDRA